MTSPLLTEPGRVDEPQAVREYSDVLTQVASERRPVIVRRNGEDLAAVVPLEHLDLLRRLLARLEASLGKEAEKLAAEIDWDRARKTLCPPQDWFDGDEPKPF